MARRNGTHRLIFEATDDVAPAQDFLNIDLPDDTARVQVEIDAETPLPTDLFSTADSVETNTVESTDETTTLDDWTDTDDESTDGEYECVCGKTHATKEKLWGHQGHCDDYTPVADRDDQADPYTCDQCEETFGNNGAYATHVRWNHTDIEDTEDIDTDNETADVEVEPDTTDDSDDDPLYGSIETASDSPTNQLVDQDEEVPTTSSKPFLNFPTLDELPEIDVYLTPGSDAFHLAALLYRADEHLKMREIHERLKGTDWEVSYKSTSAQLSQLRNAGIVEKEDEWGGKWWLTQLGKQYVKATVYEADTYPLRVADELTGINSPSTDSTLATAD